jgi:hypothetical protein
MRASWREGWGARASRCGALGLWLVACSAAEPGGGTAPTGAGPAPTAGVVADATSPPLPDSVTDLVKLAPKGALAVIGLPGFDALTRAVGKSTVDLGLETIAPDLEKVGLSSAFVSKTLAAFDGAIVAVEKERSFEPAITVIARVKDESVIEPLTKAAKLEQIAPDRWQGKDIHVAWLAKAKVAIISSSSARLEKSIALASASSGSFSESALYKAPSKNAIWLALDPSLGGANDTFDKGSVMRLDIDVESGAMMLELVQNGDKVPRIAELVAATAQDAVGKLPSGAIGATGFSIKRPAGKTIRDWFKEAARSSGSDFTADAEQGLQKLLSLTLADVDRALGDELAFGAYYEGKRGPGEADLTKNGAIIGTVAIRDEKVARSVVDAIGKLMVGAKPKNGSFRFEKKGIALDVKTGKDVVTIGFGAPAVLGKLAASKSALGATSEFSNARKAAAAQVNGLAYLDFPKLMSVLPAEAVPMSTPKIDPVLFVYQVKPNDLGSHYVLSSTAGLGAVATLGSVAAIGVYGVRRYLQSAKTSEAKNTLGAIGRGAVAAYEREMGPSPAHALCKSAVPVPATVPSGKKYQPSGSPGSDYETGSPLAGWKCLKFTMTSPQYFQYDYRVGGNYKGPKRGLPNPGPNGFEASAEGDLDGDGKTSLFTLTGKIENGMVKLSTELSIADQFE